MAFPPSRKEALIGRFVYWMDGWIDELFLTCFGEGTEEAFVLECFVLRFQERLTVKRERGTSIIILSVAEGNRLAEESTSSKCPKRRIAREDSRGLRHRGETFPSVKLKGSR